MSRSALQASARTAASRRSVPGAMPEDRLVVDWSGVQRSRDCVQGVVQCHVQFRCVWASAPDRCTLLGGGEDQSLGEMRRVFVASPKVVPARQRVRVTLNVVFADIFSSFVGRSESGRVSLQDTPVSP